MWDANSDWSTLNDQSPAPAPGWANAPQPMAGGTFGNSAPPPSMPPAQMGWGGAGSGIPAGGPATAPRESGIFGQQFQPQHGTQQISQDPNLQQQMALSQQGGMMGGRPPMQGMGGGAGMGGPPMAPQPRPMPSYGMGGPPPPMSPGNFGNFGPRFSGYGRLQGGFGSQGMPQRPQFSMGQNGGYNPQSMLGQLRSRGGPPSTGGPSNSPPSAFGDTRYEGQ